MKRTYFLVAIASLQIILGSFTLLGAAQPVRMSGAELVTSGNYYLYEFGILGSGWVSGNLTEIQGPSFVLYLFDDAGYASFRDGSNSVAPLFQENGTNIRFNLNLANSGEYHLVAVDLPQRRELQLQVDLVVGGLKTTETIIALIVLVGGLALVGATLMLSVWSGRRPSPAPAASPPPSDPSPDPLPDPSPEPSADPPPVLQDPPDDDTRIY